MNPPSQTETDLPPPPFGGAQGAAHRFAQDLNQARYRTSDPEQLLGEGGIGRVIIAEETLLRRPVAMKTLRDDRAGELYEARLIREARITGLLEHPSIVPVHDIGRNDDGKIYYTMKKVVGLTLREVIEHLRPATGDSTNEAKALRESVQERFGSIPARLSLFQKVCDAIAFAHAHPLRVIHRDLKPENIMVGEFGEVLVMDWGLAKVLVTDEETLSETPAPESTDQSSLAGFTVSRIALSTAGQFVGTPMYAAPEQLEGRLEDIDEKSDVYALGGVLYHLLTLEAPISGESQHTSRDKSTDIATQTATAPGSTPDWDALVRFIRGGHAAPLLRESTGSKSIPEALRPLLQRALAPDRSQRISSVSALQQAISQFLTGYANAFEEAGAWKHFVYFVKRHKGVALASAAALIIIATLTAGFTRRLTQELTETNRQLERSQVEEGRAWLERGRAALNKGDHLSALMLAGRAVGYQGYGRTAAEPLWFTSAFPLLLGKPMKDPTAEKDRAVEAEEVSKFIDTIQPTNLPLWTSAMTYPVTCVTFSPDGTRIASGLENNTIKLWDAASGRELASLKGYTSWVGSVATSWVSSVAFSPDGTRLVGGSEDKTIKIWDSASVKELAILKGHTDGVLGVVFSPDGTRLASSSKDKTIKLWDSASGKELTSLKGHTDGVRSVAFSPDGTRLASGSSDHTVKLWDSASGKELASLKGHTDTVICVAFSPDGMRLASGSSDHTIKLWDAASGKELANSPLLGHAYSVWSIAFSPDGSRLVSGSVDNTIKLWGSVSGKELASLKGHTSWVSSVAFSPDGNRVVSGAFDKTIKLWDFASGKELSSLRGHTKRVTSITFSPDGTRLASGSFDNTIKLWDSISCKELATLKGHTDGASCVAFSSDSTHLASGSNDHTIKLWDSASGKELASLKGHGGYVLSVAFCPDGTRLASGSYDRTIKLWDFTSGRELASFKGHTDSVCSVAFSPDGKRLVSGSSDRTIKLWDSASGRELASFKGHTDSVCSVAFSPDGKRLVSGSSDRMIKLWDSASGREVACLKGHTDSVCSVVFSPDGTRLASGSSDSTIKLWDSASCKELASLKGHTDSVCSVVFSPDGTRLASGSFDNTINLWDFSLGKELTDTKQKLATVEHRPQHVAMRTGSVVVVAPISPPPLDLTAPLRTDLLTLPGRELYFPIIDKNTPMLHMHQDALSKLADTKLKPERRAELRMELCAKSSQFRCATTQWKALPEQAPNSPIRRLYLLALIDATKHPQIHGHPTICQSAAQIAPILTKEMMAMPTISLAMMSLMRTLAEDASADMKAPRDFLLKKLDEVASPEWLAALQAATTKP